MRIDTDKMRMRRLEMHFSQAELADKAKTSQNHYSCIETGQRIPKIVVLDGIAQALDMKLVDLLIDEPDKNPTLPPAGSEVLQGETE